MIKAIIFDCFGVIITDALQLARDELATRDPQAAEQLGDIVKAANRGMMDPSESRLQICELLGITLEQYEARIVHGATKNSELMRYICDLRKDYKTGMLSNVGRGRLALRFTPQELSDCFDAVVESGDIGCAKPEVGAYEITAERLGVQPEECIFVDDRDVYCLGAQDVGMQAIHYADFNQLKAELERLLQL